MPLPPFGATGTNEKLSVQQRREAVKQVRAGASARSVARGLGVTLSHLQHWLRRAGTLRLDRVDWADQAPGPAAASTGASSMAMQQAILRVRKSLSASDLGECGARAIHAHLKAGADPALAAATLPSIRTIGRVLKRAGLLDGKTRTRRAPPPRGWYLPDLARRTVELDSFDTVEGLVIAGGADVEVLNVMSLHGSLPGSWPDERFTTDKVLLCMIAHWQRHGLPRYAQFDNAPIFQGPHHYADTLGRVVRLCQQLGVTPVFAPPRETGFQAAIESYNARWQSRVWQRFTHADRQALQSRSAAYVTACEQKNAALIAAAKPLRRPFPDGFQFQPKAPLTQRAIFLKRSNEAGQITVMGRVYDVSADWQHRLVRVEVDFTLQTLDVYALRRAAPSAQPKLLSLPYAPADKQALGFRAQSDVATRGRRLYEKRSKP